jgi:phage baseplate assembly protein W
MAFGYSAVIPLQRDNEDGFYVLTKTLLENTKQNFKNLLLTSPGERVMLPDFGVGLRRFLFENNPSNLETDITIRINDQVNKYLSFLLIDKIEFVKDDLNLLLDDHILAIRIFYSVPSIGLSDMVTISKLSIT